ncbi:Phosphate metabolism transcription protein [Mucor velutinosus]|uniref:Purple acid phosphatase n=1 Tax=Mucor velutinosus TaxID=708070 RepID=A0AAN7DHN2_9FUNG|nr:Phosphate metabolism transcription protein [Mucor velutinosus]
MYILLLITSILTATAKALVINNKTVICYGGPGTLPSTDLYNKHGDWNRTYHPAEPQQIHTSWVSNGKAIRVQFSTISSVENSRLHYWYDSDNDDVVYENLNWEFVDGGIAKKSQFMHTFTSKQLVPSTIYKYNIETTDKDQVFVSNTYEFHTPQEDAVSFKFLATGDLGVANAVSMPLFKELAQNHDYDFVAIMGDQGYNLDDFNGTKGDQYMNFAQDFYANVPLLTTAGNHEEAFDLMPYYESNFDNAMQYSIDYKSLHLISFATEVFFEGSDAQVQTSLQWLESDLIKASRRRAKVPWIIVIGHRPLYCSILSNPDCKENAETLRFGHSKQQGLESLLVKYNVDIGHKHNYERTFPVRNDTALTRSYHNAPSFFQVITGNAGNYEGGDVFDKDTEIPSWLGNRFQGYGFSTIEISPRHLDLHHYETHIDGTLGRLQDHVRVSKTACHINKQRIIRQD